MLKKILLGVVAILALIGCGEEKEEKSNRTS